MASLAALMVLLVCALAWSQAKPPKVLIIFDTSNSMLWDLQGNNTRGDGSTTHPGMDTNGNGIADDSRVYIAKQALREVLGDTQVDVEFGLMRFYQEEGVNILGAEDEGYDRPINYRGRDNCSNDGQVIVPIGPSSRPDILSWMDGQENYPGNKELRGAGNTPLAQALQGAQTYFSTQVIPNDPDRDCRSYYVLLVADGEQFCPNNNSDPSSAAFALRELTFTLQGQFKIRTWVVGFGPEVNGADQLNQIARAGGTAVDGNGNPDPLFGTALFASHPEQLSQVLREVLQAITPDEICDEADNDCDGRIDEGYEQKGQACDDGGGVCAAAGTFACNAITGQLECQTTPNDGEPEVCDGFDNDCDDLVDEGVRNNCGLCEAPPVEACDNIDNDCDGVVDNVVCPEPGQECINGECAQRCQAGECFNGTICRDGFCVTPCNNADCAPWVCRDGVCADPCEGVQCPGGLYCVLGRCEEAGCEVAGCPEGQICRNNACIQDPCEFANCAANQGCRDGICIDTCLGVECPAGEICQRGVCSPSPCAGFDCPADSTCVNGICVEDPCASVICEPGTACIDGVCGEDICARTQCPDGTYCQAGECVNGEHPVPEDQRRPVPNPGPQNPGDNGAGGEDPNAGQASTCGCHQPARTPDVPWGPLGLLTAALGAALLRRRS